MPGSRSQRALGKDWGGLAGAPVAGLSAEALGLPEGSHVEGKDVPCGATKLLGATAWDVQSPAGGSVGLGVVFEAWEVDGVTVRAVAEEEPANEKVSAADPVTGGEHFLIGLIWVGRLDDHGHVAVLAAGGARGGEGGGREACQRSEGAEGGPGHVEQQS